jgi:RHS repeat-associated protein
VSHVYGAGGERTALAVSATGTAYYAYDPVGRMASAQAASPELGTAYYEYRPDGLLAKKTLGNGCYTYFAYDEGRRLTQLLNCFPDGRPLLYFEYGYDGGSRITSVRREDGVAIYYGYDLVDRLTSENWYDAGMSQLYAFQWDYDPAGNRTCERRGDVETYYSYDEANELLHTRKLPADEWTYFQYDPRGNTVAIQEPDGTTYFAYNALNIVTAIAYKSGVANYFYYDAQMRRYAIEESTGLSYFTWDQNSMNLLSERDAGGNLMADYAHGHAPTDGIGSMTAARKPVGEATYYQYPIHDHRGTVMRLLDEAGKVVAAYEYNAWGRLLDEQESGTSNRFHYQSNWICGPDSGADLCLSPSRVYHAGAGRFLQPDQARLLPTCGGFPYACGNPVGLVDPYGLWEEIIRKGGKWARVCATADADPVADLAVKAGLNPDEAFGWTGWLRQEGPGSGCSGPRPVPVQNQADIRAGRTYLVPNTVGVGITKVFPSDPKSFLGSFVDTCRKDAERDGKKLSSCGFHVEWNKKVKSEQEFRNLWMLEGLYGIIYGGHGTENGLSVQEGLAVRPPDVAPRYHLALIFLYGCYSADLVGGSDMDPSGNIIKHSWTEHLSANGAFRGYTGAVSEINRRARRRRMGTPPSCIDDSEWADAQGLGSSG